mgnify:CR=1 FL=1
MGEEEKFNDWEPYVKFSSILQKCGMVRVYFCATSCGLDSFSTSRRRLEMWMDRNGKSTLQLINRSTKLCNFLAVRADIRSDDEFKSLWLDLMKVRARCGHSIFVSEHGEMEVVACEPGTVLAIEKG